MEIGGGGQRQVDPGISLASQCLKNYDGEQRNKRPALASGLHTPMNTHTKKKKIKIKVKPKKKKKRVGRPNPRPPDF